MTVFATPALNLIEPVQVEDEFCSGLARIEDLGSCARFVLYSKTTVYEAGDMSVFMVRKKIVLPIEALKPGIEMTLTYLARKAVRAAGSNLLRLVR